MIKFSLEAIILAIVLTLALLACLAYAIQHDLGLIIAGILGFLAWRHYHPKAQATKCPDCELKEMSNKCQQHQ